jgi:hypothetical protein
LEKGGGKVEGSGLMEEKEYPLMVSYGELLTIEKGMDLLIKETPAVYERVFATRIKQKIEELKKLI